MITPHEDSRRRPNGRRTTRQYTAKTLRTRCNALREQLLGQQLATAEELAAVWPGGPENGLTGFDGWIACFAQLTRFAGRLEQSLTGHEPDHAKLEATVRAAAARQPIGVTLSIGHKLVYPKSAYTLSWLDALDAIARPVAHLATQLAESEGSDDELRGLTALAQGMAFRTWAWILTSEGVGLPFGDEGPIAPPAYTEHLLAEDLLALYVAHKQLHFESIAIMAAAMPREDDGGERSRLTLSGFLAGYSSEHGLQPSHLMHRWSFPEAMAAAVAAFETHRVADVNAKRKRREGAL